MPAHPEDDLLADLAADVLPVEVARQVEAHVMSCTRCSEILSAAEAVSAHLHQTPPDRMPPQVMAQLERSFAAVLQGDRREPMSRGRQTSGGAAGKEGVGTGSIPTTSAGSSSGAVPMRTGPVRHDASGAGPRPSAPVAPQPSERPAARSAERSTPSEPPHHGGHTSAGPPTSYTVRPLHRPGDAGQGYPADEPTTLPAPVSDDGPESEMTQPVARKRRARPAAPPPETSGMTTLMRPVRDRHPGRLTRMDSTQAVRIRRQAMEEQRADEPSRWPKIRPQLVAAVVLVMVLAGGAITWRVSSLGSGSDDVTAGASSSADTPLLATVQMTGTQYEKADLKSQINKLVQNTNAGLASAAPTATTTADETTTLSAQSAEDSGGTAADGAETSGQNGELLTSSQALQACLKAIDQDDAQPVAVDLATYNGQEAALIVLPGTTDGYEVWVVARTCQPGADGTIAVVEVGS